MREPYTQLYLHLVWATWDRLPLITPNVEPRLYGPIIRKCRELKCVPIRIGGIENHTHLLVRLHTTIAVATLVKEVKGSSSHLMTHEIAPNDFFKWQGAYGALFARQRFHKFARTLPIKNSIIKKIRCGMSGRNRKSRTKRNWRWRNCRTWKLWRAVRAIEIAAT